VIAGEQELVGLIERIRAGDAAAARELVEKYGSYLLRVVRHRLHRRMRSKFDSQDFVQDVWASFFADLPNLETAWTSESLITLLQRMAQHKVVDAVRARMVRGRHNVNREAVSLNDSRAAVSEQLPARQATPSTAAMSREEWERLLHRQPLVYRHILMLRRDGKTIDQIAAELDLSERTVRRVIEKYLPGTCHERHRSDA
jgi:RNA polymerase sigma-70 factor (ECF subfamily)